MPYPPKPPTGRAVAAALKRAGFSRSEILTGTGRRTEGYEVKTVTERIRVRHLVSPAAHGGPEVIQRRALMLQRYADALLLAGFRARIGSTELTVHGRHNLR